jgi:acetylornithine/N-succinyldiaminopimelate aminotransferase
MNERKVKQLFADYSLYTYNRVGPVFVKGKGSWLWDSRGKKYLDLFPGWGVGILGHCHPGLAKAISEQCKKLIHLPNNLFFEEQAVLAQYISKSTFPSKIFFGNSGAEGIEGAIKISRLYGQGQRHEVICMKDSFHGRTFAALSATGQAKYKDPFRPILPTFQEAILNDLDSFKNLTNTKTIAVLLELVQGEGGIRPVSKDFIQGLVDWCEEKDLLLIVDEVQTGMGRLGKMYAFEYFGIMPDIVVLSKGLGAGMPISAIIVGKNLTDLLRPGLHASTFGGSPLATRACMEVYKIIKKEKLLSNVVKMGDYLNQKLNALKDKYSVIKEVRGIGLMQGIELNQPSFPVFTQVFEKGVILNSTHDTVMRIMPALNVTKSELDHGLGVLEDVLKGL